MTRQKHVARKTRLIYSMRAMYGNSLPNQLFLALYAAARQLVTYILLATKISFPKSRNWEKERDELLLLCVRSAHMSVCWIVAITLHNTCSLLWPVFSCGVRGQEIKFTLAIVAAKHYIKQKKWEKWRKTFFRVERYKTVVLFLHR